MNKRKMADDIAQEVWNRIIVPEKNKRKGFSFVMLSDVVHNKLTENRNG